MNITKIIFTEGLADKIFIEKLIKNNSVKIIDLGSKSQFKQKTIKSEIDSCINDANDKIDLLLIRDADDNFNGAKQAMEELKKQLENNASINKYLRNINFYILPNNADSGQLEHLLCEFIKSYDKEKIGCIEKMTDCLKSKNFITNNRSSELQLNGYLALKNEEIGTKKFLEGKLFEDIIKHLETKQQTWFEELNKNIKVFLEK